MSLLKIPAINELTGKLGSWLAELDTIVLDEFAKRDTIIATRDTEITNLRATIVELGAQIALKDRSIQDHREQNHHLQAEILTLRAEIERLKNPPVVDPPVPPIDPPPVIEVSPDITVSLEGIGTYRPPLKGERQGKEVRYRGALNSEIDIVIDCKDDGQIAICTERCWADLPATAPTLQKVFNVFVGKQTYYANPLRVGHHTRPRFIVNPSKPPQADLQSLISANLIPNYNPSAKVTEEDLKKIQEGRHPWTREFNTGFDPISEEYGQVVASWTGGAGPLMNEAGHLMPVQVAYLLTQDPRAWAEVVRLANSSGNYAIHYKLRDDKGGRYPTSADTASLPFLQGADPVTLKSQSGATLPVPEPAHEHNLTYLAYVLTGERYYREELEAWCSYNLLTRPKGKLREQGIVWSGQIRAAVWSLRALLHAYLAHGQNDSANSNQDTVVVSKSFISLRHEILNNLKWMTDTFVNPASPEHLSTGVCSLQPFRLAPLLQYVQLNPKPRYFATWHHHVLSSVLNECVRAGFTEAIAIRNHLLRVIQGVWSHSLSPYHFAWGNHAYNIDSWPDIIRTTFEGATIDNPVRNTFPNVSTPDYIGWARSAVVAAVDASQPWANKALEWIDTEAPKYKGGVPLVWQINPIGKG